MTYRHPQFLALRAFWVLVEKSIFLFFCVFLCIFNEIGMACGIHYVVHVSIIIRYR